MRRGVFIAIATVWLVIGLVRGSAAQDNPYTFTMIADGFSFPTAIVQPPDDPTRLFIADLHGKIYVMDNGTLLDQPFLDLSDQITTETYAQGVDNLVFHPHYAENGYFYVSYSQTDGNAALVRYTVSSNPNQADPTSAKIILVIPHPTPYHYGGQLAFGPDGDLYWSMGDGATQRSPAQNLKSYLGGMVRLDVDGGDPYRVPPDNPYVGNPDALPELWAKGLRNPWRFSFDHQTGDLYIADVGESAFEELDYLPAHSPGGANFGWNEYEGNAPYNGGSKDGLTFPVMVYPHDNGNCSITGGYVYHGSALPDLVGKYVFADYCSRWLWTTARQTDNSWYTAQLFKSDLRITTFGEDNQGELYAGDARFKAVYKLVPAS